MPTQQLTQNKNFLDVIEKFHQFEDDDLSLGINERDYNNSPMAQIKNILEVFRQVYEPKPQEQTKNKSPTKI